MTLIKSISGIRGTIGGKEGQNLTPIDIVKFSAAFGYWLIQKNEGQKVKMVLGRDARPSGAMLSHLVASTLQGLGIDVLDCGLSTTPTVEMMVIFEKAHGGIILTASHNPAQWNALKLLNEKGEFISGDEGLAVLKLAESGLVEFAPVEKLGTMTENKNAIQKHIESILQLPLVDAAAIRKANFSVALDGVNSTGGMAIIPLLERLGVENIHPLYCDPTGNFPHNPEPLPEHLTEISNLVKEKRADVGFVVDPDVDRLAMIAEDGSMFGEEYTLVAVADYVLAHTPGNTVSNLSSSRALRDITEKHGGKHAASAVGEVNVVDLMKSTDAVIGGEGNGGVIYPELHYGRDALVGIALFLSLLAHSGKKVSELKNGYPQYAMSKNKIEIAAGMDVDDILKRVKAHYSALNPSTVDGVKVDFEEGWVHLRKSNTEPIIRIYSEGRTKELALQLAEEIIGQIKQIIG